MIITKQIEEHIEIVTDVPEKKENILDEVNNEKNQMEKNKEEGEYCQTMIKEVKEVKEIKVAGDKPKVSIGEKIEEKDGDLDDYIDEGYQVLDDENEEKED